MSSTHEEFVPPVWITGIALGASLFFAHVDFIAELLLSRGNYRASFDERGWSRYVSNASSLVHACICTVLASAALLAKYATGKNYTLQPLLPISIGYLINDLPEVAGPPMAAHHVATIAFELYACTIPIDAPESQLIPLFLLMEVSSVPLAVMTLLRGPASNPRRDLSAKQENIMVVSAAVFCALFVLVRIVFMHTVTLPMIHDEFPHMFEGVYGPFVAAVVYAIVALQWYWLVKVAKLAVRLF